MAEIIRGLNLVLLGRTGIGKSASGNTILGKEAFISKKSSTSVTQDVAVESGTVGELSVTVYDTPGLFNTHMSEEEIQQKYEEVLQRCESGPCVFLLVIKADRFTEKEKKTVEKIEKLLGEKRLKKTWILFTGGDELEEDNTTIKEFIDDNEPLKKLIQKYDQRYHVFNNNKRGHTGQVQGLILKILKPYFDTQEGNVLGMPMTNPLMRKTPIDIEPDAPADRLSSRRIVLLGKSGVGKSAAGNTILGQKEFDSVMRMSSVTRECSDVHTTVSGRSVSVVDTPAFFDTKMKPEVLAEVIARSVYLSSPGPHAFLIVFRVDERFTEHEQQILQMIEMLFGQEVLRYSIILFTHGDHLYGASVEKLIRGNSRLRDLVQQCGGRYHIFNNKDQNNREQVNDLLQEIDSMIEQNGGGHYSNQMFEDAQRFRQEEDKRKQQKEKQGQEDTPVSSLSSRRIVLLGKSGVGKSAAGNTILGQKEFNSVMRMYSVTRECSEAHATVSGRSVSVVDTPAFFDTQMKPEELAKEIAKSVYLSSPGPHAFLIVFPVNNRFTEQEQQIPQMIEMMFGQEVLKYSIILFTHGDHLYGASVEKLIRGNSRLRDLVYQCGGRYHIFNNKDQNNREQVNDLLQKIDTMIEQNGGGHYSNQMFEDAQRLRREEEERRQRNEEERKQQKEKQRQEDTPVSSLSSRRIVLLGKSGVGKSASGNTILGQREFDSVMRMNSVTRECSEAHATVSGRSVSVVDTPAFFDTKMHTEELAEEIARSVYLSSPGPHAFLIVFRVIDRFTDQDQQIPQIIEMLFGQEVLKYSIILFTHGDLLKGVSVEKLIEENRALRDLVQQSGGRYHIFNNKDQNNREQVNDLLQKIDTMIEQNGGGHYSNQIYEDALRFRQEEEEEQRQREKEERKQQMEKQRQEEIKRVRKETEERIRAEMKGENERQRQRVTKTSSGFGSYLKKNLTIAGVIVGAAVFAPVAAVAGVAVVAGAAVAGAGAAAAVAGAAVAGAAAAVAGAAVAGAGAAVAGAIAAEAGDAQRRQRKDEERKQKDKK